MVRLYLLLFLLGIALAVLALIGCLSAEEDEIRALPRLIWVLVILLFPLLGSIAWFVAGRPVPTGPVIGGYRGDIPEHRRPPQRPQQRPPAPDDDPEFLRSLNAEQSRKDRELFDRWEEDLRRREGDLRREQNEEEQPDT
jgi:hypothetical protein